MLILALMPPVGIGRPSSTSGSALVKAGGAAILLDGDEVDYMARDYDSFLQSMRSLIPEKLPEWTDYES